MFILERCPYFLFLLWTLSCLQLQPRAMDPPLPIIELTLSPTSPSSTTLPIPIDSSLSTYDDVSQRIIIEQIFSPPLSRVTHRIFHGESRRTKKGRLLLFDLLFKVQITGNR